MCRCRFGEGRLGLAQTFQHAIERRRRSWPWRFSVIRRGLAGRTLRHGPRRGTLADRLARRRGRGLNLKRRACRGRRNRGRCRQCGHRRSGDQRGRGRARPAGRRSRLGRSRRPQRGRRRRRGRGWLALRRRALRGLVWNRLPLSRPGRRPGANVRLLALQFRQGQARLFLLALQLRQFLLRRIGLVAQCRQHGDFRLHLRADRVQLRIRRVATRTRRRRLCLGVDRCRLDGGRPRRLRQVRRRRTPDQQQQRQDEHAHQPQHAQQPVGNAAQHARPGACFRRLSGQVVVRGSGQVRVAVDQHGSPFVRETGLRGHVRGRNHQGGTTARAGQYCNVKVILAPKGGFNSLFFYPDDHAQSSPARLHPRTATARLPRLPKRFQGSGVVWM